MAASSALAIARPAPALTRPPTISYHQHLLSPQTAALWSTPTQPAVALPDALAQLLKRREQAFGAADALAALYTESAIVLNPSDPTWVTGRAAAANHIASAFSAPYRVTSTAFQVDNASGHIAGYLTRGEGDQARHFAHVLLAVRKEDDGVWRIAAESLVFAAPRTLTAFDAAGLIAQLDAAGIDKAVVLSVAYVYGDPRRNLPDAAARIQAENDWTASQVARFADRLIGFCSVAPLAASALDELARCASRPGLAGLKLHLGNSGVDLRDPAHVAAVARVFAAANDLGWPIVAHMKTRGAAYGRRDAEIFLERILPRAPDVPVQVAHMAGSAPGYPAFADEAFGVLAEAVQAKDPRARNLYFDVTTVVTAKTSRDNAELIARRLRQVGLRRVLFGADLALGGDSGTPPPREAWAIFRAMLPLTDAEFDDIAANRAPYLR